MNKAASKALQFLERTGKYSDRISRRGYMPGMVGELHGVSMVEQVENIKAEIDATLQRLNAVKEQLKETLPYAQFAALDDEKASLGARHQDLLIRLGNLNRAITAARHQTFAEAFLEVAVHRLHKDTFAVIKDEVHTLLQRRDTKSEE